MSPTSYQTALSRDIFLKPLNPKVTSVSRSYSHFDKLRDMDLNQGPSGYEPDELPDCSIPRCFVISYALLRC